MFDFLLIKIKIVKIKEKKISANLSMKSLQLHKYLVESMRK